jgi:CheY-like chemotaxis protein
MGYATETVTDGVEAIQRYRETHESGEKFDFVILDLTVPDGL